MRGTTSLEALDMSSAHVPHYFRCPISLDLMRDPVTVSTGHTYDRSSIETWMATGNTTCPITRFPLDNLHVIPNHTLRRLIQDWCPSSGVTRSPTPKQPADPVTVRSLLLQASSESTQTGLRLAALSRLRRLAFESEKNRRVIASEDAAWTLVQAAFSKPSRGAVARECLAVVSVLPLAERECVYVASEAGRVRYLASLLFDESVEVRVDSAAVIEMVITGTQSAELREKVMALDDLFKGVVGIVNCPFSHPRALRVGIRTLLAVCLARPQRHRAVAAGAVPALIDKMTDLERHDAERALAVVELLCRIPSGCAEFAAHALTVPMLAKVLRVSERATEFAAGALLAVCTAEKESRREAMFAGVMTRMLLVIQSKCTERAKRKAQALLKLLRDSWPEHCPMGSSDDYYGCNDVVPF